MNRVLNLIRDYTARVKGSANFTMQEKNEMRIFSHKFQAATTLSWFLVDHTCGSCFHPVIVTQGKEADYRYYCSNPDCEMHTAMEEKFDIEDPPDWCWYYLSEPCSPKVIIREST